jgi:hypothetical protein
MDFQDLRSPAENRSVPRSPQDQCGGRLVAPAGGGGGVEGVLRIALAQVRAEGADLVYGGRQAQLAPAGAPTGPTLAGDRRVRALAGCLGDVVAAEFVTFTAQGRPTMVAVGVRRPNDRAASPRAVTCAAWPTTAAADAYAAKVRDALARGVSRADNRPYADRLRAPAVEPGGDEHVVAWTADTPADARTVVQMLLQEDLPALPNASG